ncbi:predicted protein [Histoplasma capsulatum var. duboisii H88]|uniref:Predicted protein n=2 Tax=Ajellomyces capsulatus TaxID=5037 RepID=F0U8B0_AJEC8|nr:predicted protein [Histoplasma capsulatum H143]EGC40868.1 predicted protein [Histoplasma capsulatum var. duboisii H88]
MKKGKKQKISSGTLEGRQRSRCGMLYPAGRVQGMTYIQVSISLPRVAPVTPVIAYTDWNIIMPVAYLPSSATSSLTSTSIYQASG